MKLSVNTKKLQDMVTKASKCASCKSDVPSTGMIAIEVKDNVLTLTTTDENTYLYISDTCENEDFYVVVSIEIFAKLISKLTCEEVEMELVDDYLKIRGNGNYNIELQYDGEGELVKFTDPRKILANSTDVSTVSLSNLKMIYATAKASLDCSKGYHGCYTGYYMGKDVLTTDSFKICLINTNVFDEPVIVRPETMTLIDLLSNEEVQVTKNDRYIMLKTDKCTIFSQVLPYLSDFQHDEIKNLVENELNYSCVVDKAELLEVLDRLSLFVTGYDDNGVMLTFTEDGIDISSRQADGVEHITYEVSENYKDFSCLVNIIRFADQVKSVLADKVNLFYGDDNVIKIEDGNITKIVALIINE